MARKIDLRGVQWLTLGKKNSGKTNFNKWILGKRPAHLAFDPMDEFKPQWGYNRYKPEARRGEPAIEELEMVTDQLVFGNADTLQYFFVDEVSRFHNPNGKKLKGVIGELVDVGSSHLNMGIGFSARKPQQVHPDLRDMSEWFFIFRLRGSASVKLLGKQIDERIPELHDQLNQYECVAVPPDGEPFILSPVPEQRNNKGQNL